MKPCRLRFSSKIWYDVVWWGKAGEKPEKRGISAYSISSYITYLRLPMIPYA